jgi:hypothetical protein
MPGVSTPGRVHYRWRTMSDRHVAADVDRDVRLGRMALVLAALPFVVSAISLLFVVGSRYHPASDHALIEMQIRDVGRYELLKGLYSRDEWSHPGPFFAYLAAPFYRLSGQSQITTNVLAVVINGLSILGMGLVARRRGGLPLLLCTLLASSLLIRTLGAEFTQDPWNCFVTVLPYGLLILLAWSLTCGDAGALLPATVVTTFLAQVHVGFVLLAVPLYVFGVAGLLHHRWRHPPEGDDRGVLRSLARPLLLSATVGFVLWLPTIVDVVKNSPSNLTLSIQWFRAASGGTHGFADGWWIVMGQLAMPPEWLIRALGQEPDTGQPTQVLDRPFPWLLAVLLAGAVALWRRRPGDGGRLVAIVAVTLGLGLLAVMRTVGPAFYYRLRWVWIPPMIAFALVAWAAWLAVTRRWPGISQRLAEVALVALAVVTAVNVSTAATSGIPLHGDSEVLATITPPVLELVDRDPDAGVVLVADVFHNGAWYARGLVLELERRGIPVKVPADREALFGEHRVLDGEPVQARLVVAFDEAAARLRGDDSYREVAAWTSVTPQESAHSLALRDQYVDGEIDVTQYYFELRALDLYSRHPATYYEVSVFLDEAFPTAT